MKALLWIGAIALAAIWLAAVYVVFFTQPGVYFR